ncbi:MAG: Spy/CpxP family protein refolding chaperone [Polyangiaceae bacterium]|nr:Spy/CpxP family protein refolding chaperone [Polyangiaceae bacterium]
MRKSKVFQFVLPACAVVAFIACGNKVENEVADAAAHAVATGAAVLSDAAATGTAALADAAASVAPPSGLATGDAGATAPKRGPMMHGPASSLIEAARAQTLKDEQKTAIDKLEEPLHEQPAPRTEWKDFQKELADGVKAGKIDTSKLAANYTAIETGVHAQREKEATALNSLHSTLDATQRKAVVAAVRAKQQEGMEKHQDAGAPDMAKKTEAMNKQRLERMTKELDLDAAQQKKVEAILTKESSGKNGPQDMMAEMKKSNDEVLSAFEKDTFDATKLESFAQAGKKARAPAEREAQFYSQLLAVLTPVQRDKMAANMTRMGPMMNHPGMHPGMNPRGGAPANGASGAGGSGHNESPKPATTP